MPSYSNGLVPPSLLVIFNSGWNSTDGDWWHGLPPAAYARHLMLVARALARTGRLLEISEGWGAYRPLDAQYNARRIHGIYAAFPGTSSHGLYWEGRQVAAADYSNWAWVYAGFGSRARAEFYADCRAVGLQPGLISEERGYPDEPWHVVFPDPWGAVPAGYGATEFLTNEEDELDVIEKGLLKQAAADAGVIKQLLQETAQWQGIIATVSQISKDAGIIKQLLAETDQWPGLVAQVGQLVGNSALTLAAIADSDARDAARDAALAAAVQAISVGSGVDPDALSKVVLEAAAAGAASSLAAADFPTDASIAAAVLSGQERARLAELQAEIDRLTGLLNQSNALSANVSA